MTSKTGFGQVKIMKKNSLNKYKNFVTLAFRQVGEKM
jgi:hypothetical protein